jgi:hypothetical protein
MYKLVKTESEVIGKFKLSGRPIISEKKTVLYDGMNGDFAIELYEAFFSRHFYDGTFACGCGRYQFFFKEGNKTVDYELCK